MEWRRQVLLVKFANIPIHRYHFHVSLGKFVFCLELITFIDKSPELYDSKIYGSMVTFIDGSNAKGSIYTVFSGLGFFSSDTFGDSG